MLKSIRWRLQAWHAGLLTLVVAGLGSGLYYQVRQARIEEIDAELHAAARNLEGTLRALPPHVLDGMSEPPMPFPDGPRPGASPRPWDAESNRPPPPRDRPERRLERELALPGYFEHRFGDEPSESPYFVVWLANGDILKATPRPPEIGSPDRPAPAGMREQPYDVRQRGPFREVIVTGPRASRVLVGRSIRRESGELARLGWQLLLTGLGVLAVGLVGGWLLSGRAVRPLQAMTATAVTLSASNLSSRIEVDEVDSELGRLAHVLNEMFARLESAFERQVRFTADASHELRTPLSIVHSHAELALARPRTAEEYREALDTCLRASRRMKALVEGLLTLARADAGKLEMKRQPFDLGALTEETADLLLPLAAAKDVQLSVAAPPLELVGDAGRLAQVLTNLLTNAIHYNRPGGTVTVTLATEDGAAVLAVADTGCGIPEEDREHIFERFYRVDKVRTRELGGSGLGLAICKSIVEAHDGSITFTTKPDQGTTFVVRLPGVQDGASRPCPAVRGE